MNLIFIILKDNYVYVWECSACVCVCVYVYHMCLLSKKVRQVVRSPGTVLPILVGYPTGADNRTCVLQTCSHAT